MHRLRQLPLVVKIERDRIGLIQMVLKPFYDKLGIGVYIVAQHGCETNNFLKWFYDEMKDYARSDGMGIGFFHGTFDPTFWESRFLASVRSYMSKVPHRIIVIDKPTNYFFGSNEHAVRLREMAFEFGKTLLISVHTKDRWTEPQLQSGPYNVLHGGKDLEALTDGIVVLFEKRNKKKIAVQFNNHDDTPAPPVKSEDAKPGTVDERGTHTDAAPAAPGDSTNWLNLLLLVGASIAALGLLLLYAVWN